MGWKARSIAQEIYDGLKIAVGVVEPLRGDLDASLTVVQKCMSHLMADNLSACYVASLKTLPEISDEESDDQTGVENTAQEDDEEEDDDIREVLINGYLVKWW
ncbi:hypothetical protein BGZ65_004935 [Modicella reniformis]|uniref:Uncharacterized protein n=1 Tax=Modicella reniformis TaxID=1440133 RepID=A0A9P6SLW3_9FUNG|nr:hypothetical protein BGZ65_004935 [Modicella reniformis]